MNAKSLIFVIVLFTATSFFCFSKTIAEDKTQNKASSNVVKVDDSTKNEIVKDENIYIADNVLYIKTPFTNDMIFVYNASGLCIDKFVKETELVVKDASAYPVGVLTITNGKDLIIKIKK